MVAPRQPPALHALVDELLAEQNRLQTPVVAAGRTYDRAKAGNPESKTLPQLIPLTAPGPGEQYAFEVDLDARSGCKACVVACHSLNGLDESEAWRDVGCITGGTRAAPYQQTITTACHHCADPACLNGCPVLAYEKDPLTGIVRHLDDQCIGCQYCILKCPYDVPKYNARLGIVRKCDMCHQRLADGEAPACAQACPTHAIRITKVPLRANSDPRPPASGFLPCAPDPSYTLPTTRYVTHRPLPAGTLAADAAVLRPQPPHWPLVALLTLMPMAVGCACVAELGATAGGTAALAVLAWSAGTAGLAVAGLHLGQPRRAWRVFLGLRRSWFSREAVLFGAWLAFATPLAAARLDWLPLPDAWRSALGVATAGVGGIALFCSVMIYVDTRRRFWRFASTVPRFFGSALVLGLAGALATGVGGATGALLLAGATAAKLALEATALAPLRDDENEPATPARQTARLLAGPLRSANALRLVGALLGGIVLPLALAFRGAPAVTAWLALALCFGGELAERYLFFRAVDAPKMPGQPDPRPGAHA